MENIKNLKDSESSMEDKRTTVRSKAADQHLQLYRIGAEMYNHQPAVFVAEFRTTTRSIISEVQKDQYFLC